MTSANLTTSPFAEDDFLLDLSRVDSGRHRRHSASPKFLILPALLCCFTQFAAMLRSLLIGTHTFFMRFGWLKPRMRAPHLFYGLGCVLGAGADCQKSRLMRLGDRQPMLEIFYRYLAYPWQQLLSQISLAQLFLARVRFWAGLSPAHCGRFFCVNIWPLVSGYHLPYPLGLLFWGEAEDAFSASRDIDERSDRPAPYKVDQIHLDKDCAILGQIFNELNFRERNVAALHPCDDMVLMIFPTFSKPLVVKPAPAFPHADIKRRLSILAQQRIDVMFAWVYFWGRHLGAAIARLLRSPSLLEQRMGFAILNYSGA